MKNKECFKMNLSDYFSFCQQKSIRGLALITDKQYIFYSQLIPDDYRIHNDITIDLENMIHPHYPIYGIDAIRCNHIQVSSLGNELFIELPLYEKISKAQYYFLSEMLKEIRLINLQRNNKIGIIILSNNVIYEEENNPNISLACSSLNNLVTKEIKLEKEKIVGKVLKDDIIINVVKYNIDLENCLCLNDLIISIKKCDMYYLDNYYRKYLIKLFPDYIKVRKLLLDILIISNKNINLENITYTNILEKLQMIYNKLNHIKVKKR